LPAGAIKENGVSDKQSDKAPDGSEADALRDRLDKLSGALDARRPPPPAAKGSTGGDRKESGGALAAGMRAASELVAGVLVGGFIGWQLDAWLGTRPWLLILFFGLGVAGAFWNLIRTALRTKGK
jgi:ATP synthase protein I